MNQVLLFTRLKKEHKWTDGIYDSEWWFFRFTRIKLSQNIKAAPRHPKPFISTTDSKHTVTYEETNTLRAPEHKHKRTTACNRGQTHNTCFPEHCVQACCVFVIEFTVHRITETVLANNCLCVFKTQFINDTSAFLEEEARITVSQLASYIC